MEKSAVLAARRRLADADEVFVLTGAGLSAEAGLPTYRGENGLWSQVDPRRTWRSPGRPAVLAG